MKILAIDPGETTGVCLFKSPQKFKTKSLGKSFKEVADLIYSTTPDFVVYERFTLYPSHAKALVWDEMYTSQTIGVIRYVCELLNIPTVVQSASDKEFAVYPKDYKFPNNHERDAYGHAWYYYMNKVATI